MTRATGSRPARAGLRPGTGARSSTSASCGWALPQPACTLTPTVGRASGGFEQSMPAVEKATCCQLACACMRVAISSLCVSGQGTEGSVVSSLQPASSVVPQPERPAALPAGPEVPQDAARPAPLPAAAQHQNADQARPAQQTPQHSRDTGPSARSAGPARPAQDAEAAQPSSELRSQATADQLPGVSGVPAAPAAAGLAAAPEQAAEAGTEQATGVSPGSEDPASGSDDSLSESGTSCQDSALEDAGACVWQGLAHLLSWQAGSAVAAVAWMACSVSLFWGATWLRSRAPLVQTIHACIFMLRRAGGEPRGGGQPGALPGVPGHRGLCHAERGPADGAAPGGARRRAGQAPFALGAALRGLLQSLPGGPLHQEPPSC